MTRSSPSSPWRSLWRSVERAAFGWTWRRRAPRPPRRRRGDGRREERLRIARELHDIIGHSLGTIAVQAGVGRHLMANEPEKAAEALDSIARVSRSSLDEVRAVVAALREDEPDYHPTPGLADLPDLVETVRSTGLTVELTLPDDLEAIPRQTGAAVYRIAREALTNVVRHAHASDGQRAGGPPGRAGRGCGP